MSNSQLYNDGIDLLRQLISIPSFSREESGTASLFTKWLFQNGVHSSRVENNVFAQNQHFDPSLPTILLNSHHDTVKPNSGYTRDPFSAVIEGDKLFGLGSNDAGGPLVSLAMAFLHFYKMDGLKYNLVFAATAEEEISGEKGIAATLPYLPAIDFAIVGEPTKMDMAVAERGLVVLDCVSSGVAGHAARDEGENAIYKAVEDIRWLQQYRFEKVSPLLGPVKISVTSIETSNKAHNVVPAECSFVADVRVNELYTIEEVVQLLQKGLKSTCTPRSTRLRSTSIPLDHPVVKAGSSMGKSYYGSPTTSDKALMPFPALKMGPGDSARSHTADEYMDEYIYIKEIEDGIDDYIRLLNMLLK
jgi:acetylornithine deacetylase